MAHAHLRASPATLGQGQLNLRGRQEVSESRRWPPSTSPVPIFTASGTTRSNQATVQRQRLIPDNPLASALAQNGLDLRRTRATARSGTIEWVDPLIGGRVRLDIAPGHELFVRGDVGGF